MKNSSLNEVIVISAEEALEALNSIDDYAKMDISVDAIGPRTVLETFIQQNADRQELVEQKNSAYFQRNVLVAALASQFPSGVRNTEIEGWNPEWNGCCYIDLPSGQISYHFHESQSYLFKGLPAYNKQYDGHDKDKVHERLLALT